ncbi:MAG: acetyl-CoA C-acyltransferase [Anaerolineales bacterium]
MPATKVQASKSRKARSRPARSRPGPARETSRPRAGRAPAAREVVIVSAVRTAVGRAPRGSLRTVRPDEMAAAAIQEAYRRAGSFDPQLIDDVLIGCAFPEAEQGLNVGRIAALRAGLPVEVPGATVNRFCSSGLQALAMGAQEILAGQSEVVIVAGTESMSMVPMTGNKFSPNPQFALDWPGVYLSMGLTAERVAKEYQVSREDQDRFSLRSHEKAVAAQAAGRFAEEILPLQVEVAGLDEEGRPATRKFQFEADEGPRRDTNLEALSRLKPAFLQGGTVTPGNSSQTSDGAAALVLMEAKRAATLGLKPLARYVAFAVRGVPPEVMGVGPIAAVPRALERAGLKLEQIDLIELNEAFAAQSLAVIRKLKMDPERVNVNGGAIALGHPLGCTGAKLSTQILYEMKRRHARYGLVTMCIGGGMGAAGVLENLGR